MALTNVKLDDKTELTLNAESVDFIYILRQVAGGGFSMTDYKINVRNLKGNALPYASDGVVPDPTGGTMYFNSTSNEMRGYDGTDWFNLYEKTVKITLTAAQIKAIGTTPIVVVPKVSGAVIVPTNIIAKLNWGSVAFDANNLDIGFNGSDYYNFVGLLDDVANNLQTAGRSAVSANDLVENVDLKVSGTDSVATGDSTIDIYVSYKTIIL